MEKNKIKFNPIGDKVLVDVHPFEKQVNGIYRVDHLRHNHKGTVVAVNGSIPVNLNDVVVYNTSAGVSVELDKKDYTLLRVDEIHGIIQN